jgi:hypothetical protein
MAFTPRILLPRASYHRPSRSHWFHVLVPAAFCSPARRRGLPTVDCSEFSLPILESFIARLSFPPKRRRIFADAQRRDRGLSTTPSSRRVSLHSSLSSIHFSNDFLRTFFRTPPYSSTGGSDTRHVVSNLLRTPYPRMRLPSHRLVPMGLRRKASPPPHSRSSAIGQGREEPKAPPRRTTLHAYDSRFLSSSVLPFAQIHIPTASSRTREKITYRRTAASLVSTRPNLRPFVAFAKGGSYA